MSCSKGSEFTTWNRERDAHAYITGRDALLTEVFWTKQRRAQFQVWPTRVENYVTIYVFMSMKVERKKNITPMSHICTITTAR